MAKKTSACTLCGSAMWKSPDAAVLPVCHPCRRANPILGPDPVRWTDVECERCGDVFASVRYHRPKFCSAACVGKPRRGRTCTRCGATFDANGTRQQVCSVECSKLRDCATCGATYVATSPAQRFCSSECKPKPAPSPTSKRDPTASRVYFPTCHGCGVMFTAQHHAKRWCSYRCQVNNTNDLVTSFYALACDIKRPGEASRWRKVLLGYLVERDGPKCAICRKRVDLSIKSGTRGSPMGPSIDHIVPRSDMSGDGTDDLANLRLTHWGCNQRRGNRGGFEQLALVG